MTQILDSLPADCANRILCYYSNNTRKIKLVRITNLPNWYFERVIFPRERLLFEALPEAQLEVYVTNFSTMALVEVTRCDRLAIKAAPTEPTGLNQQHDTSVPVL
ncbi:DUF1830 domain-containing protein [Leptolyngbya sp. FACHB-321]|uniref:DUF1830 domain-containing protein n=1 Tax=Leptolyngbya sp. FACHB-321 TaxID=2692807 RepID=UPI0016833FF4|nr:DUF1830 domain-containing protein [Leptolyngbya sp. FACHB-321]MBD2037679.1 DUF1830 domain-containing protein [Leptolyngbya sp. FACHB-321]